MKRVSRRAFLKGAAAAGAAAAIPGTAGAAMYGGVFRFTAGERAAIEAVADTLIVPRSEEDPGGAGLGTFRYVARLLEGSVEDAVGRVFGGGPLRADLGDSMSLEEMPAAKVMRWRKTIARDRGVYREGVRALDERAGSGGFAALPLQARTALLRAAQQGALGAELQAFFDTAHAHTMEAAYGHPVYGGNAGGRAWARIGFPGDRFDDPRRTWGYTHREIGEPGEGAAGFPNPADYLPPGAR